MKIPKVLWDAGFFFFADRLKDRFVAGETVEESVERTKILKQRGEKAVINVLGEHVTDPKEAIWFRDQIIELITMLAREGLTDTHVAEKPSSIGLDISEDFYTENKVKILEAAQDYLCDALVETDAEQHSYRESVFRITLELSKSFSNQLLAVQLNRKGAAQEIKILNEAGIPIRLCKGNAYPGDVEKSEELRRIFLEQVPVLLEKGRRPAFATHDLLLIDLIAERFGMYRGRFEFDLLLGIEEKLAQEPDKNRFTFRRYLPCGPNWRPYGKRRAESIPGILWRNWCYRRGLWA